MITKNMMSTNKLFIISILLLISNGLFACIINYEITDSNGNTTMVRPDRKIPLTLGEKYTLSVEYTQDHGKCDVAYDDTQFILDDEKWKSSKDYLSLQLLDSIEWLENAPRAYVSEISFIAKSKGESFLEVIRDCDRKAGYDEILEFKVN